MQLKKLIISVFLLLAYSIGFAHEIIPHCHHNGAEEVLHFPLEDSNKQHEQEERKTQEVVVN